MDKHLAIFETWPMVIKNGKAVSTMVEREIIPKTLKSEIWFTVWRSTNSEILSLHDFKEIIENSRREQSSQLAAMLARKFLKKFVPFLLKSLRNLLPGVSIIVKLRGLVFMTIVCLFGKIFDNQCFLF